MKRAYWLLLIAGLLAAVASEAKTVSQLTRRLTGEQSGALAAALNGVAKEVVAAARRAGPTCRVVDAPNKPAESQRVTTALATGQGLFPLVNPFTLRCGEAAPAIRVSVATTTEERASLGPPKAAPLTAAFTIRVPEAGRRALGGASTVFVQTDAALIRLDVSDEPRPGALAAQLDARALTALAQQFAPLPLPRPFTLPAAAARPPDAAEERAVVAALLAGRLRGKTQVLVGAGVGPLEFAAEALKAAAPDLDPTLLGGFVNQQQRGGRPALPPNAIPAPQPATDALFKGGPDPGWVQFGQRYPNAAGLLQLSPIAFSRDGTQAAVATRWQFGAMDGIGAFYVLQRAADGSWSVLYESVLWLS